MHSRADNSVGEETLLVEEAGSGVAAFTGRRRSADATFEGDEKPMAADGLIQENP
jgi:hypothetical protein